MSTFVMLFSVDCINLSHQYLISVNPFIANTGSVRAAATARHTINPRHGDNKSDDEEPVGSRYY